MRIIIKQNRELLFELKILNIQYLVVRDLKKKQKQETK